jgi:hypothetical protein
VRWTHKTRKWRPSVGAPGREGSQMRSRKRSLRSPVSVKRGREGRGGGRAKWQILLCVCVFFLPVNIISGRQSRSTEPGARLDDDDDADDQPMIELPVRPLSIRVWGTGTKQARVPFAESSRFFDILLNVAYLSTPV